MGKNTGDHKPYPYGKHFQKVVSDFNGELRKLFYNWLKKNKTQFRESQASFSIDYNGIR